MKLEDIITLAKAGYTPKQVKELLEMVETSPKVQETPVDEAKKQQEQQPQKESKEDNKQQEQTDPLAIFNKLLD